jgi:hypothetical protein
MAGKNKQGLRSEDKDLETTRRREGRNSGSSSFPERSGLFHQFHTTAIFLHLIPQAMDWGGLGWAPHGCNSNLYLPPPGDARAVQCIAISEFLGSTTSIH